MHYTLFEGKKTGGCTMSLHKEIDDQSFTDMAYDEKLGDFEEMDNVDRKRQVRRMLEDRLERKRLKEELEDELDGEFDWDELER
jgi:2-oxoglutarate dehydrogenase complex dehydrogenase (E1) component-like enzyme